MRKLSQAFAIFLGTLAIAGTCFSAQVLTPQTAVVVSLYKHFAFEAVIEEPDLENGFLDSSREILLSYLTPSLAQLIIKDRKCAADTHKVCKLDFLPLWNSQDPSSARIRILPTKMKERVEVQLQYGSETRVLTFFFTRTNRGWRIRDIGYENEQKSLVELLGETK